MMKTVILTILFALFHNIKADDCNPGDVWADGKIKMQCTHDGTKPIACLPSGKLGDNELQPGETFVSTSFKFACKRNGELEVTYDVVACVLPNGQEFQVGSQSGLPNKGLYRCVKNADNTISRKFQAGCFNNTRLYTAGQSWKTADSQVICESGKNGFEAKASGCLTHSGDVVQVGSYSESGTSFFKCQVDASDASKGLLVQVAESEYREWLAGNGVEDEEAAGGQSGSGQTRPRTTTTTTTTTTPQPTTTRATTQQPTTPEPTATTLPPLPPFHPATVIHETTGAPAQCADLHPICETLCNRKCSDKHNDAPSALELEPVGFAFINRKRRSLTGVERLAIPSFSGNSAHGKLNLASHSRVNSTRRPPGLGKLSIGNSLHNAVWSANGASQIPAGKPASIHQASSDSNDGDDEAFGGRGQSLTFGRGNNGNGRPAKLAVNSVNPSRPVRPHATNNPRPRPKPQESQCDVFADNTLELVHALCPRSCNLCDKQINLNDAAQKWVGSSCLTKQAAGTNLVFEELEIGLGLTEEITTSTPVVLTTTTRRPAPARPAIAKPTKKPKHKGSSSSEEKHKNKGKGKNKENLWNWLG